MPKYLIEASYTLDGVKGVRSAGGSARREAVSRVAESLGGQFRIESAPGQGTRAIATLPLSAVGGLDA